MKLGIVVYSNDPETVWNAFRIANFSLALGDSVSAFMIGQGVTYESLPAVAPFDVATQVQTFLRTGGKLLACGTCLEIHGIKATAQYRVSTLKDVHEIIRDSDRVLTF